MSGTNNITDGAVRHMNDTTMPPPKLSASSTSSSTTRRKTAVNPRQRLGGGGLKKGFGLYDWKLLLKKTNDLAQRKGQPIRYRDITKEEVKQHNKIHDGWIILRGNVYNLSPYIHYHPGGVNILTKNVLGKDVT